MVVKEAQLRERDAAGIWYEPDFIFKNKKVGKWVFEMIGGTDRGAMMVFWEPVKGYAKFYGHDPYKEDLSDNKEWVRYSEVHFMLYENAYEEWVYLNSVNAMLDIVRRNG
jgi:hypothetical protein